MKATWKVLSKTDLKHHSAMGASFGRCICHVTGGGTCNAKATCVVEYSNSGECVQHAPCCEACRKACFGSVAKERKTAREAVEARQLLAFDPAIVNHENPQPWRR